MGKQMIGAISTRTKAAYKLLCDLQKKTLANPSSRAVSEEADAYAKWKRLSDIEEGDYVEWSLEDLQNLMEFRCSESDKSLLTHEVTKEEVRRVLFVMPSYKSPGPDGFNVEFYKESWEIVGDDFLVAIQSFYRTGFMPKGINSTILALIPKKKKAIVMKDYRPISCCNVLYKVVSKILANRLKIILPKFILPNQSAFVKNRLLMENVFLATEWSFLLNILRALNFPEQYIHWIQTCITTASFSVQVNGELAGYFNSKRAFRLPKACIREIDQMCSAFLWSGPMLNAKKTKVAWSEVCLLKHEGGLGLSSIEEANKVSVLKLIWRLLSAKDSLRFHKVEAHNGGNTSFLFDGWSSLGLLYESLGERGCITMGIPSSSTLAEALAMTRRRQHRSTLLNSVEQEIQNFQSTRDSAQSDVALWKGQNN
ncbi:PREDICTED: uncharacterized protein LOC104759856 [Camelina sativa]|uniref:Uncharacterized protein LOC104759856 n=1 Tax=Camelina sativa TaxID=90675 RepID=A0ABM0X5I5_CAMSA|nr:PREDICTED: uncharacterized protein LOC104759856 [Camelina sativa]